MIGAPAPAFANALVTMATVVALTGCTAGQGSPDASPPSSGPVPTTSRPPGPYVVVDRVVDGDTIIVRERAGGVRVRLIGVDSPESVKPGTPVQCFALKASAFAKRALTDTLVRLEYDVDRFDRYGRTLAYVWVGSTMFNEDLVLEGYGVVDTVPPNVRYVDLFLAAERNAREHDRGLWSACSTP
jgi:micrococcal nuclease